MSIKEILVDTTTAPLDKSQMLSLNKLPTNNPQNTPITKTSTKIIVAKYTP